MKEINPNDTMASHYTEAEATERRSMFEKRENLQPIYLNKNGKSIKTPFMRGDRLHPQYSFAPALGDWSPAGQANLTKLVDPKLLEKIEADWKAEGMAGFIATTDTTAGVMEVIEYEPDEAEVREMLEGDRSVRGMGEEREGGQQAGNKSNQGEGQ